MINYDLSSERDGKFIDYFNRKIDKRVVDDMMPTFSQRPHVSETAIIAGTQVEELIIIFYKTDPLLILILCAKKLKNFKINPFWAD